MKGKPVTLVITWWVEAIVAVRVLLFAVPVIISKYSDQTLDLSELNNRFIAVLTATAVIYVLTGVVSIFKSSAWKLVHYFSWFLVIGITFCSLYFYDQPSKSVSWTYFIPLITASVFTLLAIFMGRSK